MRPRASFEDEEVANLYVHRAPYPNAIYRKLVDLAPARRAMLDIGCGPGKIARRLVPLFQTITAVDASRAMLDLGRRLPNGDVSHLQWIEGLAEQVTYVGAPFDLIVAAESIHWMDHHRLFPRLRQHVSDAYIFAVIEGDDAYEPPWQADWERFLAKWIHRLTDQVYTPGGQEPFLRTYETWIDVMGECDFISEACTQHVNDFIACQHSRHTFTPRALGPQMQMFDAELAELLKPHVIEDQIEFVVKTRLTWGNIKAKPA